MSKQLIFVCGAPCSGRTTWVKNNLLSNPNESNPNQIQCIDATNYKLLYTNSKLSEESVEASRQWCLEEVHRLMTVETPVQKIVLCLISCRADKWREFIQLAMDHEYEISFKFPSNKLLFYITKHNTTTEQLKYIESKSIGKYPRNKKEVKKQDSKNNNKIVYKETNESSMFRNVVTEFESGYAFYLENKMKLGVDNEAWLKKINEHYKATIANDIKRIHKKAEKKAEEEEKAKYRAEKEEKKLAREANLLAYELNKANEANEANQDYNHKYLESNVSVKQYDSYEYNVVNTTV
jgi:hypothetical protein